MSIHSSLKYSAALSRARNVYKRIERLQVLLEDERWSEEKSVYGLPKVRTRFKSAVKKKKKEEEKKEEEGAEEEAPSS